MLIFPLPGPMAAHILDDGEAKVIFKVCCELCKTASLRQKKDK